MPIDTWDKWEIARKDVYARFNLKRDTLSLEFSRQLRGIKDRRKKEVFSEEHKAKQEELSRKTKIEVDILKEIRVDIIKAKELNILKKIGVEK